MHLDDGAGLHVSDSVSCFTHLLCSNIQSKRINTAEKVVAQLTESYLHFLLLLLLSLCVWGRSAWRGSALRSRLLTAVSVLNALPSARSTLKACNFAGWHASPQVANHKHTNLSISKPACANSNAPCTPSISLSHSLSLHSQGVELEKYRALGMSSSGSIGLFCCVDWRQVDNKDMTGVSFRKRKVDGESD